MLADAGSCHATRVAADCGERAMLLEHDHAKCVPGWRLAPTFAQATALSSGVCKTVPPVSPDDQ
jgi:hypothetical protein